MKTFLLWCLVAPLAALASPHKFIFERPPQIGATQTGQKIHLGGVSALHLLTQNEQNIEILALTDRGPNAAKAGRQRPFALPDYSPRLLKIRLDRRDARVILEEQIPLRDKAGKPMSGLPPYKEGAAGRGEIETAVDLFGHVLTPSPRGMDPESLCAMPDGSLWIGDEYGPNLFHFSAKGILLQTLSPGAGLPDWTTRRPTNNGFEGLACDDGKLYALLQAPLEWPGRQNKITVRLLEIDPRAQKTTAVYIYALENESSKLGDLARSGPGKFLAIEQNGKTGADAFRKVYEISIAGAPNVLKEPAPETLNADEARRKSVTKKELVDLAAQGFDVEKAEGVVPLGMDQILVASDNDFGIDGPADFKKGKVVIEESKKTLFGLFIIKNDK